MTIDGVLHSTIKLPPHRLALVVVYGLLATGCVSLPETYPATGVVAGTEIQTRVDSELAAYFVSSYLAKNRRQPELDRRIDALYQDTSQHVLPSREQLKRIADDFSVDFAAIYFADLIDRVPANRLLRETYTRLLNQASATLLRAERLRLLPEATSYDMVFVPGYHYKTYPETGANLAAPRRALGDAGLATSWIETDENGSIDANSVLIADYLRARAQLGSKIMVISASKSGPEVALALSQLSPRDARNINAWINIAGTLQGSPLADEVFGDGLLSNYSGIARDAGLQSLTTAESRTRFSQFKTYDDLLTINYMAIPVTGTISERAQPTYIILRPYGPNDGLTLLPDLIAPNSVTLLEFGRDHYIVDETIQQRTVALVNTAIQWLEYCRKDQGLPWRSVTKLTNCNTK